jgi:signal transduction histidine kinase
MLSRWFVGCTTVGTLGVAFGVLCERLAAERIVGWDQPRHWLPDLLVGLALLAAALRRALGRSHSDLGVAALLVLAAATWYSGTVWTATQFWHRAPLLHTLLVHPSSRALSRLRRVAVVFAYPAALIEMARLNGIVFAALATVAALTAVLNSTGRSSTGRSSTGRSSTGRSSTGAVWVAVLASCWAVVLIIGLMPMPDPGADMALLTAYQVVVCGIAYTASRDNAPLPVTQMTDLIVEAIELEAAGTSAVRDALRRTVHDPNLELGMWSPAAGSYLDPDGRPIMLLTADARRTAIRLDRDGQPFAVLLSDLASIGKDALIDAVVAAGQLADTHAQLEVALRAQIGELTDSRRRLLVSADTERSRLETQLRDGPLKRLTVLHDRLRATGAGYAAGPTAAHISQAMRQLDLTIDDLGELARGLHPRELRAGLSQALEALAEHCPVPVELDMTARERYPIDVESTVYFVTAEALANVVKHAGATLVRIEVHHERDLLRWSVIDNGVGGADPRHGTGLLGLTDRVTTLGGSLTISSNTGTGTALAAELPNVLTVGQTSHAPRRNPA